MFPLLWGLAIGATAAFVLDPQQGRRRRALARDQVVRRAHEARAFLDAASKDARQRMQGAQASVRSLVTRREPGGDVLEARVRSRLGRSVSHPHAIHVRCIGEGVVALSGDVLAAEHEALLDAVRSARGVHMIRDLVVVHDRPDSAPSLQGGIIASSDTARQHWSPATRLASGSVATGLVAFGLVRSGIPGVLAVAAGAALLVRSWVNRPLRELPRRVPGRSPALGLEGRPPQELHGSL